MSEPIIELRVWRQFLTLAEELHFGRAAARLHMTQPPLTQAVAQLERVLGVRLFDRTKRSVHLTEAGSALVPEVRALLARAQTLPGQARSAALGGAGTLRLAFVSTVGYTLLPSWVRSFRSLYPRIQLELVEATSDVQLTALERGDIDAGILLHAPGFAPSGPQHLLIAEEPMILAIPETHRLARSGTLPLGKVLAEPIVVFPRRISPSLHDALFGLYHSEGREPPIAQEAIQMQTIVNLVSAGLGLAWVPESVREFQRQGVVYRSLPTAKGRRIPTCQTSLIWANDGAATLARFLDFARQRSVAKG
jgi:DNA-binding transcriptional LysR family regulator